MMEEITIRAKKAIRNMRTIGYWSMLGGVEVKHIEYGIDDYLYCVSGTFSGTPSYHKLLIQYDPLSDRQYVSLHRNKLYLDECIRSGI